VIAGVKPQDGKIAIAVISRRSQSRNYATAARSGKRGDQHQLSPTDRKQALRSAGIVGLSAVIGSLLPLMPFLVWPVTTAIPVSIVLSAFVLFAVGAYKARTTIGHPTKSGLEMAIIGTVSALLGYFVGLVLKVPTVP